MPKAARAKASATPATRAKKFRPSAAWSPGEDRVLETAHAKGMKWKPIAEKYFPNKTSNACRKRHERLVYRRNAESWDGMKLERLATQYMNLRRNIWQPLADSIGESWQFVEAKCMEKGLSSLNSSARSAGRRSSDVSGMDEFFAEDHDSGIAMEDEAEMDAGRRQSSRTAGASRTGARASSPAKQQPLPYAPYQPQSSPHLQLPPPISPPGYVRSPTQFESASASASTNRSVSSGPTIASLLSPSHPPAVNT